MVADARFGELLRLPLDWCRARLRVGVRHLRRQRLERGGVAHGDVLKGRAPRGLLGLERRGQLLGALRGGHGSPRATLPVVKLMGFEMRGRGGCRCRPGELYC
jgi:hypothetical protein